LEDFFLRKQDGKFNLVYHKLVELYLEKFKIASNVLYSSEDEEETNNE